jgi:hypothetical protein
LLFFYGASDRAGNLELNSSSFRSRPHDAPDAVHARAASEPLHKDGRKNAVDSLREAGRDGKRHVKGQRSALEKQAADVLRRARRLPVGAARNDLRQLAMGLLWLHRNGMDALMKQRPMSQLPADGENVSG